jgi:hypothetical protein
VPGDARGFYCKIQGHFKVADTISVDEYYNPSRMGDCVACGEAQVDGRGMACYKARGLFQIARRNSSLVVEKR